MVHCLTLSPKKDPNIMRDDIVRRILCLRNICVLYILFQMDSSYLGLHFLNVGFQSITEDDNAVNFKSMPLQDRI